MRQWIAATVLVLNGAALAGQSERGTIRGAIVDATGAALARVAVVASNVDTGMNTSAVSNDEGLYSILDLPLGRYSVTFARDGFGSYVQHEVIVGVRAALRIDVTLQIGGVQDSVTVTDIREGLDTRSAATGTSLSNAVATSLPLTITSGRSLESFAYAIAPGVEGNNWTSNIVGGAPFSKEVILDGSSATIQIQGHISESSPPMDAVQEFKVDTSGMPAEYGRTGGGIFNFSLRSGTNTRHGSAYGQVRHEALNANTWMNEYLATTDPAQRDKYSTPRDRQRLGGASVGGPIRQNRTFYFASFEEYRQTRHQLGAYDRTVPTAAFLDGNFSALLDTTTQLGTDPSGAPIYRGAIFDPRTGLVFPGNVIPSDRLSPISRRIAAIYRDSYTPAVPNRIVNNAAGPAYVDPSFTQHQFSVKADHSLTTNARLSGSLIWTNRPRTLVDQGGVWNPDDDMGGPLSKARRHEVTSYQARISHSQALSPSVLHAGTITFNRFRNPSTSGSADGDWPNQLGLNVPGAYGTFPQVAFGDATNGVDITDIGYGASNFYVTNVWQFNESISWIRGRHLMKFGGEARFIQMNSHGDRSYLAYTFSSTQTGVLGGPFANQVGSGFASFMLGEVASASQHVPTDLYGRRNYQALFWQDDYRVHERLTLNLGLRWETTGGWREKYDRWANFNTSKINPVTGVAGVLEYADEVDGSFEGRRDLGQFGPRIGAAFRISDRLVFRGAYGLLYAPIGVNYWNGVPYGFAPGFFGTNTVTPTANGAAAFNWDRTPYPGVSTPPVRDPASTQWGLVSINPNSLDAGRIQQWNAGVEREVARDISIGAAYVGNRGTRLGSGDFERNQPNPEDMRRLLLAGTEWNWVSDPASAEAAGVRYPYPGFAGTAWMAITPYPQAAAGWGPLFFVGSPLGRSDYHALQVTATKRGMSGLSAIASYTLARQRGNMDSAFQERWWSGPIQDVTRLDQEAVTIAAGDRRHVAKGFVSWALPFGTGRRFLGSASGIAGALASGWTISTIFRYESGLPLAIRSSNGYAGWTYPIYANVNTGVPVDGSFDASHFNPSKPLDPANRYFNPQAFSNPPYGELGTGPARLVNLRGFGGAYEDIGVIKDIRVGRYTAQVRFELFNVFNRRYFADPETNLGSAAFGQVTSAGSQPPRQGQFGLRLQW
jgi:Carboxypeptidase regulatory-like domain